MMTALVRLLRPWLDTTEERLRYDLGKAVHGAAM